MAEGGIGRLEDITLENRAEGEVEWFYYSFITFVRAAFFYGSPYFFVFSKVVYWKDLVYTFEYRYNLYKIRKGDLSMAENVVRIWTVNEDKTLSSYMEKHKDEGIFAAMRQAASVLNRSFYQVKNRWYTKLNPDLEKRRSVARAKDQKKNKNNSASESRTTTAGLASTNVTVPQNMPEPHVELLEQPHIKVFVSPITKASLDSMSLDELFDLHLNVIIKIQEATNERRAENRKLHRDLNAVTQEKEELRIGYTSLLGVIETARKMAVSEGISTEGRDQTRFKMDTNGNLERIV